MGLLAVVAPFLAVVAGLLGLLTALLVGRSGLARARRHARPRLCRVGPYLLVLGAVLAVNRTARTLGPELSWLVGWNITPLIYAVEGNAVAAVQSVAAGPLTGVLAFAYVYGYAVLVSFPLVAYFAAEDPRPLETAAVAYALNYGLGLLAYVLFIAYGPRNVVPAAVDSLLYGTYPRTQLLTRQVNVNSNVFPSLHGSLSVTVALLARRTRDAYPRWAVLAPAVAGSVLLATTYLGIHWVTDVVAGAGLAVASLRLADRWFARADDGDAATRGRPAD